VVTIKQVIEMVENEDSSVFVGSVWELKDAFIAYPIWKDDGEFLYDEAWLISKKDGKMEWISGNEEFTDDAVLIWKRKGVE
jgi:hypothetical protein